MSAGVPPRIDLDRHLRRGVTLELITLGWNVAGVAVLAVLALAARSVALAGFGLDSLIEIGASVVVLWELRDARRDRERSALVLIAAAFASVSLYLAIQSTWVLVAGFHPRHSPGGIAWTAATALAMFALAREKGRTGQAASREVLIREGRVTFVDGVLALAVLLGLCLNTLAGWWWADPASTYVIVGYGLRECVDISRSIHERG